MHNIVLERKDSILVANFRDMCPIRLTITASQHDSVDPRSKNYPIDFFITSNEDITDLFIHEIKLNINKNIFYPTSVNNNCVLESNNGNISVKNIAVPSLKMDAITPLFTIRGNVLLGDVISSTIKIIDATFEQNIEKITLVDGYISIDICQTGGSRLAKSFDYEPSITVAQNPATDLLEVECKVIEVGNYSLEIVDILGQSTVIKK